MGPLGSLGSLWVPGVLVSLVSCLGFSGLWALALGGALGRVRGSTRPLSRGGVPATKCQDQGAQNVRTRAWPPYKKSGKAISTTVWAPLRVEP